jgi:hypothetical protein
LEEKIYIKRERRGEGEEKRRGKKGVRKAKKRKLRNGYRYKEIFRVMNGSIVCPYRKVFPDWIQSKKLGITNSH